MLKLQFKGSGLLLSALNQPAARLRSVACMSPSSVGGGSFLLPARRASPLLHIDMRQGAGIQSAGTLARKGSVCLYGPGLPGQPLHGSADGILPQPRCGIAVQMLRYRYRKPQQPPLEISLHGEIRPFLLQQRPLSRTERSPRG